MVKEMGVLVEEWAILVVEAAGRVIPVGEVEEMEIAVVVGLQKMTAGLAEA